MRIPIVPRLAGIFSCQRKGSVRKRNAENRKQG